MLTNSLDETEFKIFLNRENLIFESVLYLLTKTQSVVQTITRFYVYKNNFLKPSKYDAVLSIQIYRASSYNSKTVYHKKHARYNFFHLFFSRLSFNVAVWVENMT